MDVKPRDKLILGMSGHCYGGAVRLNEPYGDDGASRAGKRADAGKSWKLLESAREVGRFHADSGDRRISAVVGRPSKRPFTEPAGRSRAQHSLGPARPWELFRGFVSARSNVRAKGAHQPRTRREVTSFPIRHRRREQRSIG